MTATIADLEQFAVPGQMPRQLLQYWVHGKGAAKIRWGTPGDFNRCVRNLRKYVRDPKGLCNRLHTRALGAPPGQGHALAADAAMAQVYIDDPGFDETPDPDEAALFPMKRMWRGTLAPMNKPTGDKRRFAVGGISARDRPLPLLWQKQTGEGHSAAVVVGRILDIDIDDERVYGVGDWLDTPEAFEAQELVKAGILHPSVDLDSIDFQLRLEGTDTEFSPEAHCTADVCQKHEFVVTQGRVSAATLVAIPAFAEAKLELYDGPDEEGLFAEFDAMALEVDDDESCGCGMTAAAIRGYIVPSVGDALVAAAVDPADEFRPPRAWFDNPQLAGNDPGWYYTADGQVFGRIGGEGVCHLGAPDCKTIPHSETGYAYFHQSWTYTAEGERIRVGKLIYGGKHATLTMGMRRAYQHYDDTSRAFAIGRVYEDEFGPKFAGALLPGVDPTMLAHALASPLSGDWREVGGNLEMIAALAINVPGFPVVGRTDADSRMLALVASAGLPAEEVPDGPAPVADPMAEVRPMIGDLVAAEFARARAAAAELAQWDAMDTEARGRQVRDLAAAFE